MQNVRMCMYLTRKKDVYSQYNYGIIVMKPIIRNLILIMGLTVIALQIFMFRF